MNTATGSRATPVASAVKVYGLGLMGLYRERVEVPPERTT